MPEPTTYSVIDGNGTPREVPAADVQLILDSGGRLMGEAEKYAYHREARLERDYGGPGDTILGAAQRFGKGLTAGTSDVFVGTMPGIPDELRDDVNFEMSERAKRSGALGTAAEITGAVAPAFFTGGGSTGVRGALSVSPSGLIARGGENVAKAVGGKTALSRAAGWSAAGAGEGVVMTTGDLLSELAMADDPDLVMESAVARLGNGALWGAVGGAGGSLFVDGLSAAQRHVGRKVSQHSADGILDQLDDYEREVLKPKRADVKDARKHGWRMREIDARNRGAKEVAEIKREGDIARAEARKYDADVRERNQNLAVPQYHLGRQAQAAAAASDSRIGRVDSLIAERRARLGKIEDVLPKSQLSPEAQALREQRAAMEVERVIDTGDEILRAAGYAAREVPGSRPGRVSDTVWASLSPRQQGLVEASGVAVPKNRKAARPVAGEAVEQSLSLSKSEWDRLSPIGKHLVRDKKPVSALTGPATGAGHGNAMRKVAEGSGPKRITDTVIDASMDARMADASPGPRTKLGVGAPGASPELVELAEAAADLKSKHSLLGDAHSPPELAEYMLAVDRAEAAAYNAVENVIKNNPDLLPDDIARLRNKVSKYGEAASRHEQEMFLLEGLGLQGGVSGKGNPIVGAIGGVGKAVAGGVIGPAAKLVGAAKLLKFLPGVNQSPKFGLLKAAKEYRDGIEKAVNDFLKSGTKAAKRATPAIPPASVTLANSLFSEEKPKKPPKGTTDSELFKMRVEELERAIQDPEAVDRAVDRAFPTDDKEMQEALRAGVQRKLKFAYSALPPAVRAYGIASLDREVSKAEINKFARVIRALEDPKSALEDMANGRLTPDVAEAVRTAYPAMWMEFQRQVIRDRDELRSSLAFPKRCQLSILCGVPIDSSMRPEAIAARQEGYQQRPSQPQPQVDGSVGMAELAEYGPYRRSAR